MAKDPAFLFYPGSWLKGTQLFSRSHKGAYMDLLMAQFSNGHLPHEDIVLLLGPDYEPMWESKLKPKFIKDDKGLYYNEKLDSVITDRKVYKEGRLNNLKGKKKPHKDKPHGKPYENSICLNENRNKDIDKDRDKDLNKNIKYNPATDCEFFNDKDFREAWSSWNIVRQKKKCSTSDRAIKMAVKKLMDLSGGDKVKAIQILDKSANSGWPDLYALKEKGLSFEERYRKASE